MKRQCSRLVLRHSSRAICLTILASAVAGAYAQPRNDIVANTYSQMYRIPVPEAANRLELTREAGRLGQRLQLELPETFAGLYVEHEPEFRIVVQFTQDAQVRLAAYTSDPH